MGHIIGEIADSDAIVPTYSQSESSTRHSDPSKYDNLRKQIANLESEDDASSYDEDEALRRAIEESKRESTSSQSQSQALTRVTTLQRRHSIDLSSPSQPHDMEHTDMPSDSEVIATGGRKHHHYGRRLKNKLTGTTHEEREKERAERAALFQKAYENAPVVPYGYGGYGYGGYGYGGFGYPYGLGYGGLYGFGLGGFGLGFPGLFI